VGTFDLWIKCGMKQVSVAVSNVQKCYFVVSDHCRCYMCKKRKQNYINK